MAAPHVEARIERLHPGKDIAVVEREGGLNNRELQHILKPGVQLTHIPVASKIHRFARAIGCDPLELFMDFAADVKEPYKFPKEAGLSVWEEDMLGICRQLPEEMKAALLAAAQAMLANSPASLTKD